MHTKSLLGVLTLSLIICSCKKELEPQQSSVPLTSPVAQTAPNAPAQQQPTAMQNAPAPQNVVTTMPAQPTKVAPGMNPAHGQPNHRCDIPVGAPLSSPLASTPAKPVMTIDPSKMTQTQTPAANATPALLKPTAQAATPVATAPGMNPPHGQPNHRCDIAVGAPLSTPAKAAEKKADIPKMDITVSDPVKTEEKKAE